MIKRPSRQISEFREPSKNWLDKNEVHNIELHEFLVQQISSCPTRTFSSYPDLNKSYKLLSDFLSVPIDQLYIGNGSDAIIKSVFENFVTTSDAIFFRTPTFAMYEIYSVYFQASAINFSYQFDIYSYDFSWDYELFETSILRKKPAIIFLANPDSPTGSYFSEDYMVRLLLIAKKVQSIVCIDAVYDSFAPTPLDYRRLSKEFDNFIIIYSASKSWGLAGIRLGFSIAAPKLNYKLHRSRPMYKIGSLQSFIFDQILQNEDMRKSTIAKVCSNKQKIETGIRETKTKVVDTVGNFILFEDHPFVSQSLSSTSVIRNAWDSGPMKGLARISVSADMDCQSIIETFEKNSEVKID